MLPPQETRTTGPRGRQTSRPSPWTPRPSRRQTPHIPTTIPMHPRTDAPFSSFPFFSLGFKKMLLVCSPLQRTSLQEARTNQLFHQTVCQARGCTQLGEANVSIFHCLTTTNSYRVLSLCITYVRLEMIRNKKALGSIILLRAMLK